MLFGFGSKSRVFIGAAVCALALTGCIEEDFDIDDTTGSSTSTTFVPQGRVATGCPSACTDIDINTVRGIPASCQSACPNTQTAAQCVAAGGAYDLYIENGQAGADSGTLSQLYFQYQEQANLTREFVATFGCN